MTREIKKFLNYAEASKVVAGMEVTSYQDYLARYKSFPGLPSNPAKTYGDEYLGWDAYIGDRKRYKTFEEARDAVIKLGIKTWPEYKARYKEDPRLPGSPHTTYAETYLGFAEFCGQAKPDRYVTMAEASQAAVKLTLQSRTDYKARYYQDPLLPGDPPTYYSDAWQGWAFFLKVDNTPKTGKGKYETYEEFVEAVRHLKITGQVDYKARYKEDPKLPANPHSVYKKDWVSWPEAFGVSPYLKRCESWQEAKIIAAPYRFATSTEYQEGCSVDERLPKYPGKRYKDFPGWITFLLPDNYYSLADVKCAVKIINLKSSVGYRNARKKFPQLPAHPDRMFADEWVDWYDLCNIPRPYSYEELQELVISHGCTIIKDYRELMAKLKDPRMPSSPEEVYAQWKNWHVFLDKPEPYTLDFIQGYGVGWIPSIQHFLRTQRGRPGKETNLCRFIRHFIEAYELGRTPREFLTRKTTDIKPFRELIENQTSRQIGRNILLTVNSFLNEILKSELTIEDEDTGELVRVEGASNPLATLQYKGDGTPGPSESTKPALAFQYVNAMKKWMAPDDAKSFSDLAALHQFDADYFEVDESLIDRTDPDCVFKTQGDKFLLWYPGYWMHAYALVSIPARGRQIAYNDSGEADEFIPDIQDDKVVWVKNMNPLAQRKNQRGFIKLCDDGGWGMRFTSNKTGFMGKGYDVPWIPEELVHWMIKLRKWQEKYNPIERPMPWLECKRTHLNEEQLKRKGKNCFLFRSFREEEPPAYSARLAERLAAALYFTQPKKMTLATFALGGSHSTLSRYDSKYTPHSMRVSLITAYVMEFGLPIEIIMKLAGHASVIMSICYVKVGAAVLRRRMDEGHKLALREQVYAAQDMLEQNRADELAHTLVANSEQALQALVAGNVGSTLVRDYGLCPYGASRCEDGGSPIGATQVWSPVPAGYLGMQNCTRCRHFVTGPMFLGGLLSLWNEISLRLTFLSEQYLDFEKEISDFHSKIAGLDELEFDMEKMGGIFDASSRDRIELEKNKLESEAEQVAKKMDMFLCDMQSLTKQINDCKALIAEQGSDNDDEVRLVVHDQNEIMVEIEQTSLFQQLNEVCVNASIFQSASADFATPRRSQMFDNMALLNRIRPSLCSLSEKEQLVVGNQAAKFLLQRLKTWDRVDQVVTGQILLEDLSDDERISQADFIEVLAVKTPQLLDVREVMV
ncbi:VPA1269 family protein [Pseudomonas sp. Irchel 3H7]|uniref:gamma-mobile-trio integrase GmtZ n=1 Tax=Pseudomonas sp. Irchel 3H7 TaxID=2009042 RepID=UPI000BA4580C|nr:VPA1269 family protein [Pseudomonas sp. Irchel 3H7]